VFRDLDTLRRSGVPLSYDEQYQRYRIPGTYYLPPTNFTPEEALSLIVLCHELGNRSGLPFEQLRGVADAVRIQPPPSNPLTGQRPIYERLLDAAARRLSVRIRYDSLTEWRRIRTRLNPYRLLFSRRSWYVIGRSSMHRSVRTFNVGRVFRSRSPGDSPSNAISATPGT